MQSPTLSTFAVLSALLGSTSAAWVLFGYGGTTTCGDSTLSGLVAESELYGVEHPCSPIPDEYDSFMWAPEGVCDPYAGCPPASNQATFYSDPECTVEVLELARYVCLADVAEATYFKVYNV